MSLGRRQFVVGASAAGLGLLAGCGSGGSPLQQRAKLPHVAFLSPESSTGGPLGYDDAFRDGLRDFGYVDGQNVSLEWRYLDGRPERAPELVEELVRLPADIIVVRGGLLTQAASSATRTIPIVMTIHEDPVGAGVIQSLARPGGNVTGLSTLGQEVSAKRVELLKETLPTISKVGVFWNPADPSSVVVWQGTVPAAQTLGVQIQSLEVRSLEDFEPAAAAVVRERPEALILSGGSLVLGVLGARIIDLAARQALPTMSGTRGSVMLGGLMSYARDSVQAHRRAAYYVDRILKGAKPADLPVEQPMTFEFVVNMKTARELGITFPNEIMLQVTEVLQ
jgi:putative tryptophan/tyrosine transport system substrate-binding protein